MDVRSERDFNLFHIEDSRWVGLDKLDDILDDGNLLTGMFRKIVANDRYTYILDE